jgi:hypothetical protein
MREFLWGLIFGIAGMYYYTYYGHQLVYAKQLIDRWSSNAVEDTRMYDDRVHPTRRR